MNIRGLAAILLLLTFLCQPLQAFAQPIDLVFGGGCYGNTSLTLPEGDDFATLDLQNPWDMNERRDIGFERNFDPLQTNVVDDMGNMVWVGKNELGRDVEGGNPPGWVYPLFPGFPDSLAPQILPREKELPRYGINHRVDTEKFTLLSFRMWHDDRSDIQISWESDATMDPMKEDWLPEPVHGSPFITHPDGFHHSVLPNPPVYFANPNASWKIYQFDMSGNADWADPGAVTGDPFDDVFGLRIEPSMGSGNQKEVKFDWIRLVDPNSVTQDINLCWNGSGTYTYPGVVKIWVDKDSDPYSGNNQTLLHVIPGQQPVSPISGSYQIKLAMLPPGTHYFFVSLEEGTSNPLSELYRSSPTAPVTIVPRPNVIFEAPAQDSGVGYAEEILDNPWDMNPEPIGDPQDVANLNSPSRNYTNENFTSGEFRAVTIPADPNPDEEDVPMVQLRTNVFEPIDPSRYRYLTYKMRALSPPDTTIFEKYRDGGFSSIGFGNMHDELHSGLTKGQLVFDNEMREYTIDLKVFWSFEDDSILWEDLFRISNLALTPIEPEDPRQFRIADVRLTEENRPDETGTYKIRFKVENDQTGYTIRVYYDRDPNSIAGTQIGMDPPIINGAYELAWNTTSVPPPSDDAVPHSYFIHVEIDTGSQIYRYHSPVEVVLDPYFPLVSPDTVNLDFNDDGISDHFVYRPSTGAFFQNLSLDGSSVRDCATCSAYNLIPINGNFDGDETQGGDLAQDLATVFRYDGYWIWYIEHSSTGNLYVQGWGHSETDEIAVADYDGDGADDIAIWRAATGEWWAINSGFDPNTDPPEEIFTFDIWGQPGDVPVPADYDGDGIDDIAVWRPSTGEWFIINSGFPTFSPESVTDFQWGLEGDIPIYEDWTGDGRADPGIWRPSLGVWAIRELQSDQVLLVQWGLPIDKPAIGDFDGDGLLDFNVYRPSTGVWYHRYRNGDLDINNPIAQYWNNTLGVDWDAIQYGLPGDLIPQFRVPNPAS